MLTTSARSPLLAPPDRPGPAVSESARRRPASDPPTAPVHAAPKLSSSVDDPPAAVAFAFRAPYPGRPSLSGEIARIKQLPAQAQVVAATSWTEPAGRTDDVVRPRPRRHDDGSRRGCCC